MRNNTHEKIDTKSLQDFKPQDFGAKINADLEIESKEKSAQKYEQKKSSAKISADFGVDSIAHLRDLVESQKQILPFYLLGRSLSYNPYPPRFAEIFPTLLESKNDFQTSKNLAQNLPKSKNDFATKSSLDFGTNPALEGKINALQIDSFDFADLARLQSHIKAHDIKIVFLNLARDFLAKPRAEGLECVSYLRHYTDALIVLKDCFLDSYQILQAVVFGADALCFSYFSPQGKLKELVDFASHLGLASLVESQNLTDIKNAIFAKASGVFLPRECFGELISLVPKRKIICTDFEANLGQDSGKISRVDFVLQKDFV